MKVTMKNVAALCLFALLACAPLAAVAADAPKVNRGPVKVTADQLEADDQKQLLIFTGNAVAVQDDMTIHGDRLVVKYTGENREIQQVTAEGAVRIIQGERVATGAKAVLFHAEERIVLTGSPKVSEGQNSVQGEEITFYLHDKRSVVKGGKGGRVNAVFTPQPEGKP